MRTWLCILACALASLATASAAHAAATLDPTFGFGGVTVTNFGGADYGNGVAVQTDGRVVAAGYRASSGSTWYDFIGQRLEPGGDALDTSFGAGGGFLTPMSAGQANDFGEDVALAPDGKIVVAGYTIPDGGHTGSLAVARYGANGSLDPTFGSGGKAIVSLAPDELYEQYWSVVVQPDGKVLVAGGVRFGTIDDPIQLAVVRLTASGQLDPTFGDQGVARAAAGTGAHGLHVALAPGGGIVAAGWTTSGGVQVPLVVRLTAAGTLDPAFDGDGVLTLPSSLGGIAGGADVADDGDVLVGLWTNSIASRAWGVARITPAGELDTSFGGGDGSVTSTVASSNGGVVMEGLAIDSHDRVVVGGTAPGSRPAVARYTTAGEPDTLFAPAGVVVDQTVTVQAGGFTLDSSDRPLLSGSDLGDMVVARFTAGDAPPAPPDPPAGVAPPSAAPPSDGSPAIGAPSGSAPPAPTPDVARPAVKLVVKRDVVLGPTLGFRVRSDEAVQLTGTLEVRARDAARAGLARRARPVVIGRARTSLAAAGSATLRFRVSAKVRRRLARRRTVPAVLRIVARDRAGNVTRTARPVRLRAR